jgi:hypothetical protein
LNLGSIYADDEIKFQDWGIRLTHARSPDNISQ